MSVSLNVSVSIDTQTGAVLWLNCVPWSPGAQHTDVE